MTRASRSWLDGIPSRPLILHALEARFALAPGDRPLVDPGSTIALGEPLTPQPAHAQPLRTAAG
jgi:hypothetical protein